MLQMVFNAVMAATLAVLTAVHRPLDWQTAMLGCLSLAFIGLIISAHRQRGAN